MPTNDTQLIQHAHEHGHPSSTVQALLRAARDFGNRVGGVARDTVVVIKDNPGKTCLVVVCGVVFIAPMAVLAGPLLGAAGFGAAGPVVGSIAASWQASLGTVAAGSLFATLQSAAMGGVGAAIVGGIVQLGAMSILGIVLRKPIVRSLLNAYRKVMQVAREQMYLLYIRGMQRILQAQGLIRHQGRRSVKQ